MDDHVPTGQVTGLRTRLLLLPRKSCFTTSFVHSFVSNALQCPLDCRVHVIGGGLCRCSTWNSNLRLSAVHVVSSRQIELNDDRYWYSYSYYIFSFSLITCTLSDWCPASSHSPSTSLDFNSGSVAGREFSSVWCRSCVTPVCAGSRAYP